MSSFSEIKTLVAERFAAITAEPTVQAKELSKCEEIGIEQFLEKVLPTAKNIRALVTLIQAGILEHATITGSTTQQVQKLIPETGRPVEIMENGKTLTLL